jgi:adenosylcobinamide kinase/adenosylcobinamide-phosphate guanylyltransferase
VPSIFITGPVRSGKSRFAERLARERGGDVAYVATARRDPSDPEWEERIARHAARRPKKWRVVETASDDPALEEVCRDAPATLTLVVDSFGTWLAARMSPETDAALLEAHAETVVGALLATKAHAIVVGDEVGWGIVPEYASGRVFRDVLGRAQQRLATESSRAYVVVAGFALDLHLGIPVDP